MSCECEKIHSYFNKLKRYNFPFDTLQIPLNGIYILFEKDEYAHGGDRIVRVGTHTGVGQLASRLKQHFVSEKKDRSIFRKNVGRAILHMNNDAFLKYWEIDLTSKEARTKYSNQIDLDYQRHIESLVTNYIHENFSFCTVELMDKSERLSIEAKLISTISNCTECKPSDKWLGQHSTKEKVRESGLWLVNELYKKSFTSDEIDLFIHKVSG